LKFAFIEAHRKEFPVKRMCAVLSVSLSGYYAWRKRKPSARQRANERLLQRIQEVHEQSRKTYGSPRVHAELRKQGVICSKKRVARLMRQYGIRARRKRSHKITTQSQHNYPVAANLLRQDFQAQSPNQKWVTDISYIPTREGWLYLAVVMDLFSRKIVGWAMNKVITSELTQSALRMALQNRRPGEGLLHHSDRGSQYCCQTYQELLVAHRIQVSMSRTGNVYDNAPMESFFSTLKNEHVHFQDYYTRAQAKTDIFAYIEGFYNPWRRHSTLGYLSPVEFEQNYFPISAF